MKKALLAALILARTDTFRKNATWEGNRLKVAIPSRYVRTIELGPTVIRILP